MRTNPHGVYVEFRIATADWNSQLDVDTAGGWNTIYEDLFSIPNVVDVEWAPEGTASGLLQDHVIVYFTSTSGNSGASIDFPYSQFTQQFIADRVAFAVAQFDAAEAGEPISGESPPVYGIDYGPPAGQRATVEPGQGVITIH